jgi:hypothetical protein
MRKFAIITGCGASQPTIPAIGRTLHPESGGENKLVEDESTIGMGPMTRPMAVHSTAELKADFSASSRQHAGDRSEGRRNGAPAR